MHVNKRSRVNQHQLLEGLLVFRRHSVAIVRAATARIGARGALDEAPLRAADLNGLLFAALLDNLELDFLTLHCTAQGGGCAQGSDGWQRDAPS